MATVGRTLMRRLLTPNVSATRLGVRGFHEKSPAARELLETIGETFLSGYARAVESRSAVEAEERLEKIPAPFRGFAYEGAAMGVTVLDALPFGGGHRLARFLGGRGGDAHVYMAYVGIGWAMARLPRFRWPRTSGLEPLLRWLVWDGYGFHQAYFHTGRYVREHEQRLTGYAARAADQGTGRALWFVGGADPGMVADLIDGFPAARRGDLYSGAGLAATYAGGADEEELRSLRDRAGRYRAPLAQGCAFAAEARVRAGLLTPHTAVATEVICGMTPERAARLCAETRADLPADGETPAYEIWRRRITGSLEVSTSER